MTETVRPADATGGGKPLRAMASRDAGKVRTFPGSGDRPDAFAAETATSGRGADHAAGVAAGGCCAWTLPPDLSAAAAGRSLIRSALTTLGVTGEPAEATVLVTSELVTNAVRHGLGPATRDARWSTAVGAPELWLWARTTPAPELVMAVFDTRPDRRPDLRRAELLDEHGRGLGIVGMVAGSWGAHLSRSRLRAGGVPGKAVWAALPLPGPWPDAGLTVAPEVTARRLAAVLAARGVDGTAYRHGHRVSLVGVPLPAAGTLNIRVDAGGFTFTGPNGRRHRRPVIDLHDLAEHLVRLTEESRAKR